MTAPPPRLVVHAGCTGLHAIRADLRARWWVVLVPVVPSVVVAAASRRASALLPAVVLVALVLVVLLLLTASRLLQRRDTLVVDADALVVRRWRRRVVPREQIIGLVHGRYAVPRSPHAEEVVAVVSRGGRRLVLRTASWPGGTFEQVAAALGVPLVEEQAGDRSLAPFVVRHLWTTVLGGAVLLFVLIIAAIVFSDLLRAR